MRAAGMKRRQASIFQVNQVLREIKPSHGSQLAQPGMLNLEGPKQGLLEMRSPLTGMGHFYNKSRISSHPCFCSSLLTSREGGKWPGVWLWQTLLGVSDDISDLGLHEHSKSGPRVPVNKFRISPRCSWPRAPSNSAITDGCCLSQDMPI